MAPSRKRLKLSHDAEAASNSSSSGPDSGVEIESADFKTASSSASSDGDDSESSWQNGEHEGADGYNGSLSESVAFSHKSRNGEAPARPDARSQRPTDSRSAGTMNTSGSVGHVEAMLQQMRPKHTQREIEAEEALHRLRKTIEAVPALGPFHLREAVKVLKEQKVTIPFPETRPERESNLKFAYAPPATVNVVGSYPIRTATRSRRFLHIDMVVQMPDELFQEKDFINHRYFHKRAFYLACLASAIKAAHGTAFELRYQHHHDDPLKPVLTIRTLDQTDADGRPGPVRKWQINVLPSVSSTVFPASKLAPNRISLRQQAESLSSERLAVRNMAYNSSLRSDMLVTSYLKLLHQASVSCSAYRDACALGTTWLRSRGFRATPRRGGFASFEWAALLALLLQTTESGRKPMLAPHFSSMQVFKTVLHLLATRDLVKKPLHLGTGTPLDDLSSETGPVLWDATRAHNVFYKVPRWSYDRLRMEAKLCLAILGDPEFDGLEDTFSRNLDVDVLRYDVVCRLNTSTIQTTSSGFDWIELSQELYLLLKQGLGNRVTQIDLGAERAKAWQIQQQTGPDRNSSVLQIALLVDPKHVDRAVDHGPPAEDKAAAELFRSFWGPKAELRRFKDGSILEALVWDTSSGQPPVLEQITRYLLDHRFGKAASEQAEFVGSAFERLLRKQKGNLLPPLGEAFKKLEIDVRGLQNIPLPIRQIVIASSPSSAEQLESMSACDVVLQFESSGRWPDDLAAMQRTKLAFLLHIAQLLQETVENVTATVGLEHQDEDIFNQGFLDVLYPGKSLFRLRIFHDREQTLLERILQNKNADQKSAELASQALATYKREYLRKPAHAQAMQRLLSQQPVLLRTRALFSRWIAGHLLQNHIGNELIDLFVVHTFTRPWPWRTPSSVQTAFLRTIEWLARWDWRTQPLVVELGTDSKMPVVEQRAACGRFAAWRKLDPGMNKIVIFAASSVDTDGTTYTLDGPSKVVASRLTALARSASTEINARDLQLHADSLFSSGMADFDFVLHLNSGLAGVDKRKKSKSGFRNLELDAASDVLAAAASPATDFLEELERIYGSAVLLMSGLPHRPIIAGLWTPQTADRLWKMNLAFSTLPQQDAEGMRAVLNSSAMLNEMARLGGDLIRRVEIIGKS